MEKPEMYHDFQQTFEVCNWTEDFILENGNYINKCSVCGFFFRGHKRRFVCRMCSDVEPDWSKMIFKKAPDLGGVYHGCWLDGEMTGFARCMVKIVMPLRQEKRDLESDNKLLREEIRRQKLIAKFYRLGGETTRRSFYDEEGVDGWEFTIKDQEWSELGIHEDPPPFTDEILEYVDKL